MVGWTGVRRMDRSFATHGLDIILDIYGHGIVQEIGSETKLTISLSIDDSETASSKLKRILEPTVEAIMYLL